MNRGALAALAAAICGAATQGLAQITLQRNPPPGFSSAPARTAERPLHIDGKPIPSIVFVTTARAGTLTLAPASTAALAALLASRGVHERAARLWAQQSEHFLGRSSCLPTAESPDCIPARLEAQGTQLRLVLEPAVQNADAAGSLLASLGSAYASLGMAQSARTQTLTAGLATQGMLSRRDRYFEYDVNMSGTTRGGGVPRLVPAYNLLVAGMPLQRGVRGFAGLYRAGGTGLEGQAGDFFVRPRMVGIAAQSDDLPLQAGRGSQVRITLIAPSRVTLFSGGVQIYASLHGMGEHVITVSGRVGNFVDVVTQDMSGRQDRFQAAVTGSGDALPRRPWGWRAELGRTAEHGMQTPGFAQAPHSIFTALHHTQIWGYGVQAGIQGAGSAFRASVGASSGFDAGAGAAAGLLPTWSVSLMTGRRGETGASAAAFGKLGGLLDYGITANRYVPPAATAGARPPCADENAGLCYSVNPYTRASLILGLSGWPIRLNLSSSSTVGGRNRQILIQGTSRLPFGGANARLLWGLRQGNSAGATLFAYLIYPLDGMATLVTSSVSGSAGGGPLQLAASYSHQFENDGGWLESVSQSVQGQAAGSAPLAFHHHLTGHSGPMAVSLSAGHSSGSRDLQGSVAAHYGASASGLAFAQSEPGMPFSPARASSSAAIKIVNDSMDTQLAVLGSRTIEIPPNGMRIIPVEAGYAPDISISPGPVAQAERAAMPDYLFPGNVKEIHIQGGSWYQVRFVAAGAGAPDKPLRATHTRSGDTGDEEALYQNARGFAFIFEPGQDARRVRYLTNRAGMAPTTRRCEAQAPAMQAPAGTYPELIYECGEESTQGEP